MLTHSIRIRLGGGNNQVLHPGQVLSGVVEYKAPAGERLVSVNIDFRGVTKIMPKKGAKHIDIEYIELFQMGEVLQREPLFVERGKKYEWRFTFVLPTLTGPDRRQGFYEDSADTHFELDRHTLPPSIEPDTTPETKIEYNIYVVAKEQFQGQGIPQIENIQTRPVVDVLDHLRLRPDLEWIPDADPHVLEKSFDLMAEPALTRRRFSLTPGHAAAAARNNSVASIASASQGQGQGKPFSLVAKISATIIPGTDIDVALSIQLPEGSSDTSFYTHKATTLALEALTYRRTTKTPYSPALTLTSTTKFDARKAARALALHPAPPLLHRFGTDALRSLPPTFKSYSLARAYQLHLSVALAVDRKDFEVTWTVPVQLLHRTSEDQVLQRRISNAPPPPAPLPDLLPWERRRGVDEQLAIGEEIAELAEEPPAYAPRTRGGTRREGR